MTYAVRLRAESWRARRGRARLRPRTRLSAQTVDTLFAAAVFVAMTGAMHRAMHPFLGDLLLLNALLRSLLVWRRRAPLVSFLATSAVAFAQCCLHLRTRRT